MSAPDSLKDIHRQVLWDRLLSVVEEQARTLIRTGFSTSTREAGDVSAGVFDLEGRMLAQAVTGTPGHVNSMARAVGHFIERFPAAGMSEGDVYLTNDPWLGTGHLHDFTFVTPAFRKGRAVALFASTSHVVDIGGRGLGADGGEVYEEGLNIPIMPFARAGRVDEAVIAIVRANVREPVQVVGDLYSLASCNDTGARRLNEMMDQAGIDDLTALAEHILARSHEAATARIAALPAGTYRNTMRVDGYDHPVDLTATLTIANDTITVDYTGTTGLSRFGINVPMAYTEAYTAFGVKAIVFPDVPNNAGSLETIRVTAPEHSILNPQRPAPVALRHVTGQMLPDVVFGCLYQALGADRVPAEGTSCLWNIQISGGRGRVRGATTTEDPFMVLSFHSGGTGARPGTDGLSATAFPSGVRNMPVEVNESISPMVFRRKEYRQDSGGAGRQRGGLGQVMEIEHRHGAPFSLSAMFDRVEHPPRGRDGGREGMCGVVRLEDGTRLGGKGEQIVPQGRRLVVEMPGGGGLGDPLDRDPALVARDVRADFVSRDAARELYGVVVDESGHADLAATETLRAGMRAAADS